MSSAGRRGRARTAPAVACDCIERGAGGRAVAYDRYRGNVFRGAARATGARRRRLAGQRRWPGGERLGRAWRTRSRLGAGPGYAGPLRGRAPSPGPGAARPAFTAAPVRRHGTAARLRRAGSGHARGRAGRALVRQLAAGNQHAGRPAVPAAAGRLPRRPAAGAAVRSAPVRPAPVRAAPGPPGSRPRLRRGPGNRARLPDLTPAVSPATGQAPTSPARATQRPPATRRPASTPVPWGLGRAHPAGPIRAGRCRPARSARASSRRRQARCRLATTRRVRPPPARRRPASFSARPAVPRSGARRPVRAWLGRARSAGSGRPLPRGTRRPGRDVARRPRARWRSAGKPAARAGPPFRRRSRPGADADDDLRTGKPGQPARRRRSRPARLAPVRRGGRRGARLRPVPRRVWRAGRLPAAISAGPRARRLHRAGPVSAGGGVPRARRLPRRRRHRGRRRVRCARVSGVRIRTAGVRSPVPGFRRRAVPGKRRPGAAGSSRRRRLRPATRPAVSRSGGHAARLRA